MNDEKKIKKILNDLYKIDSEFKKHEKKITKIIKELLLLQPDIKPDSKFVEDLKSMLQTEEKKIDKKKRDKEKNISKNYFTSFNFLFDLSRSFVIVSVLLLLVVSISFVKIQKNSSRFVRENNSRLDFLNGLQDSVIVKKGKYSFGNLYSQSTGSESAMLSSKIDGRAYGLGSGNVSMSAEAQEASFVTADDMSIMPMPIKYNYIYTGGDFEMFESEEEVYKRVPLDLSRQFVNNFSTSGLLIDAGKFNNVGVSNFSLMEDRDYGYNVSFYLEDGSVSLYKNWKKWPRVEELCGGWQNYSCIENYRLSFNQVLSNEEVLTIANRFLLEYGVNLNSYGEGEVQNDWLKYYSLAEDKSSYYIPESISIVYPLKINNKTVYEEYGNKSGLLVEVDMREKKVSALYSLFYQNYESSTYETEGDREKIMELVYNGGYYPYYDYFSEGNYESIDVELGAPSLELVKIWNYDESKMTSQELYVPAYVFPIISQSKPSYFDRKNIIIPAVKDFFNRYDYFPGQPRILPAVSSESVDLDSSVSSGGSSGFTGSLLVE